MIVGACSKCGTTLYHDSRFVRDELHAYCADHAPGRPETPIEEIEREFADRHAKDREDAKTATDRNDAVRQFLASDEPMFVLGDDRNDKEFVVMGYKTENDVSCSRCKWRVPMDGADFCEWCAKDEDFDLKAISRQAGQHAVTATNTRDCPLCRKPVDRDAPNYVASVFRYHTACAYRISKEARAGLANPKRVMPDGSPIFPPKASGTAAITDVHMRNPDGSMRVVIPDDADWEKRKEEGTIPCPLCTRTRAERAAAERLARLVLDHGAMISKIPFAAKSAIECEMEAEARRVLGGKS